MHLLDTHARYIWFIRSDDNWKYDTNIHTSILFVHICANLGTENSAQHFSTNSQIDRMTPKWINPDFYYNLFGSVLISMLPHKNYLALGTVYFAWCFWNLISSVLNVAACKLPAFQAAISMTCCVAHYMVLRPVFGNYFTLKGLPNISLSYMTRQNRFTLGLGILGPFSCKTISARVSFVTWQLAGQ